MKQQLLGRHISGQLSVVPIGLNKGKEVYSLSTGNNDTRNQG